MRKGVECERGDSACSVFKLASEVVMHGTKSDFCTLEAIAPMSVFATDYQRRDQQALKTFILSSAVMPYLDFPQ